MKIGETLYVHDRERWRDWLDLNHTKKKEIWLILPKKKTGKPKLKYSDSVEEALCFCWIDSTVKRLDEDSTAQRFTTRRKGSPYSQPNLERLRILVQSGMVIDKVAENVKPLLAKKFMFPEDILDALRANPETWINYQNFTEPYRRIRVAYVEAARKRPEEFKKRLTNLVKKTTQNKQYGYGVERFYNHEITR